MSLPYTASRKDQGNKASREDKGRAKSISNIVNEWRYDTIEKAPHKNFTEMSGMADFNLNALALWDEMCKYGASASSAKNVVKYYPYTDELQGVSRKDRDYINGMGGIRKHSSNDFRVDYVQDYIMFYADLSVKLFGKTSLPYLEDLYNGFEEAIKDNGIGTVSEIYDGNPPFEARGCISQSTSVGALLYLHYLIDELNKKGGSK